VRHIVLLLVHSYLFTTFYFIYY